MTKRYEKFEEWMVGERVHWDGGFEQTPDSGVVIGMYRNHADTVYVKWDSDWNKAWLNVDKVTFEKDNKVEEQNTEHGIKWEVGQVVWDVLYGKGVVSGVREGIFPVKVTYDDGGYEDYTLQGSFYEAGTRTLFFSEPKIIAETMPPKKKFVPRLKEGGKVLIKDKQGFFGEGTVRVVYKECNDRIYISKDGDYFMKCDIASLQVVDLAGCKVLEPACGQMHMVEVLRKYSKEVDYFDKYDTFSGRMGDFLESKNADYDWVITNPPFNLSVEFIEHALNEHKCNVAMLLKSQYWHSAKRKKLFDKHKPKGVYPLTWRPDFHFGAKGGSPTMEVIWVVWG